MFDEEDLLPISALQHLLFCERQCALIHVDNVWLDNGLTVEGTHLHRRADGGLSETRRDVVVFRAVPIRSLRVGITGRADVIEFERNAAGVGAVLPGRAGKWVPRPVEYKRGRPKTHRADEVQLCAQGLCLEEMLRVDVPSGELYYGSLHRRVVVQFDAELRDTTMVAVTRLRAVLDAQRVPAGRYESKCNGCSLSPICMPQIKHSAIAYLTEELRRGEEA